MEGVENIPSSDVGPYTTRVSYPIKGKVNIDKEQDEPPWAALVLYSHASTESTRAVYHAGGTFTVLHR